MAAHQDNLVLSVFPNQSCILLVFTCIIITNHIIETGRDLCRFSLTRSYWHRRLNNGSFPSLSLTHKEVGGSFYTIREIVREIIQENRVLGTSDLILLDAKGDGDDQLQDQSLSRSTVLMNPVPPLFLSPDGLHSRSEPVEAKSPVNGEYINVSKVGLDDRGSDISKYREVNGYKLSEPVGSSTDVSRTQFAAASCSEVIDAGMHDDNGETICDSLPQDKEVEVDNKDIGFEAEIHFIESEGKNPLNNNQSVKDDKAAIKDTLGTFDLLPAETVVETFSVTPSELAKVCEAGKETEAKVENDSSTEDLVEIPSSISAVLEEQGTEEVTVVAQMPNHISVTI
uniref:AT3G52170-like helix-turn-helix domain-containing protein n=1 Tax=Brassica oleracea var. oleracea TaxID=109376 RepID=A0A0D3DE46_BRAOL